MLLVFSARRSKAAPEHNQAYPCRQGVLFRICLIVPPSVISLIRRPEKVQFCYVAPLNSILKLFSLLELPFPVLLGQ